MQMRETARASILSLPNHGAREADYSKGDLSDESYSLNVGQKTSGQRQYVADGSSESDNHLMRFQGPTRF